MNSPDNLRDRTKTFAIRIVRLFRALPHSREAQVIGNQVLRSGTSVGANYRAACRARSRQEFVSRLGIVVEEANISDVGKLYKLQITNLKWPALHPIPTK